ncbi:MAG TPA: rhomboid family intramembrane serine protease [Pseudolabrys sp.]|nr:rhomboid family intramembrane serine protease [Pseudolabrys sp.]
MKREPLFNIPTVVLVLIGIFAVIQVLRADVLDAFDRNYLDELFAFIPLRYDNSRLIDGPLPGGVGAEIWTFVTYAFIHGSWTHLFVNSIWFLPFGSAVARRFGTGRFLAFFAVTAAAGALAYLFAHGGEDSAVIGASAAISGTMAGAMRFAFQRGGPLGFWRENDEEAYRVPALPLSGVWRDFRVVIFLVVWFGINFLFGAVSLPLTSGDQPVAWQAHIGGFLAGLLLFGWFDPVRPHAKTVVTPE